MNGKVSQYLKPTFGKMALSIVFVAWQFFYSYQDYGFEFFSSNLKFLGTGFGYFDWGNSSSRIFSLLLVWIFVAIVIFLGIWAFESLSVILHNRIVEKRYVNRPTSDYEHLLRESKANFSFLRRRVLWLVGILLLLLSFFLLSDGVEAVRKGVIDFLSLWLFDRGYSFNLSGSFAIVLSFVILTFFWYWVSLFIISVFKIQISEEEKEQITENHFAVDVETKESVK